MLALLAFLGYEANEAQSNASLGGINFLHTALPGIFAGVAAVVVIFYNLDNKKLNQIQTDLANQ